MLKASNQDRLAFRLILIMATSLFCGCLFESTKQTGTAEVHGIITLDGSPLSQAYVVFVPDNLQTDDQKLMSIAYGVTDADGKCELAYSDGKKELLAGTYTVMISKVTPTNIDSQKTGQVWRSELLPKSVAKLPMFSENSGEVIPSIYHRNSNLKFKVQSSPNVVEHKFELTSVDPLIRELGESDSSDD